MNSLPIDALLPDVVRCLSQAGALVLEAAPGAGKTTRVPPAVLDAGLAGEGLVIVTEPRRLAVRLAAHHVARELGEEVGGRVGYAIRLEQAYGPRTRLLYATEGVVLRRLLDDADLSGVGTLILDEFHERHIETDMLLALARRLRATTRPDLRVVVMSATLESAPVAAFLGNCPRLSSEGRTFPLSIEHASEPDERPLERQIASAVRVLSTSDTKGDILVFLPGAAEIRRAREQLARLAEERDLLVVPLHGDLSMAEQARAVEPAERRKVILSTNVAESSVTIEGVTAVVDCGLARQSTHSPWSGLPTVTTAKISRAAAIQRAGRAGRTGPGRVARLFTLGDYRNRPEHDAAEIARADLTETLLLLHGVGLDPRADLDWLTRPPDTATAAAEALLRHLAAIDEAGRLTNIGRRMLRFPVPPRLARLIVEGERRGVAEDAALAAALLSERDIESRARTTFHDRAADGGSPTGPSDVLDRIDRYREAEVAHFSRESLRTLDLDARSVDAVRKTARRLSVLVDQSVEPPRTAEEREQAVLRSIVSAYVDRVARRRTPGSRDLILASGATAQLSEASVVRSAPFLVALDAEQRGRGSVVRLASAFEPDWLLDAHADSVQTTEELSWDPVKARVQRTSRMAFGSVVLDEEREPAPPSAEAAAILVKQAMAAGKARSDAILSLLRRIEILREHVPEAGLPPVDPTTVTRALESAARAATSFEELDAMDLAASLATSLSTDQQALLAREAPLRTTLGGGRQVAIVYEPGKDPWIESRLQDFFGMTSTPTVCKGRLALTVHLLAPNQRAVQVTKDLAGFWERHYPTLRRELGWRYPKHAWPEDGRTATPPAPRHPKR